MAEKKRYHEIDVCRGIGIILVVLGHALKQTGTLTQGMDGLLSAIYSFHMPLFFILSGFTSLKVVGFVSTQEKISYIRGRAKRLLIPYFVIGILYIPLKMVMSRYAIKPYDFSQVWKILIGENPNTALWFLYILFLCCVLSALLVNLKNLQIVLAAAFLLCGVSCIMGWTIRFPRYYFFFVLGIMLRSHYAEWKCRFGRLSVFVLCAVVFTVANIGLYRYDGVWFMLTALSGSTLTLLISCALTGGLGRSVQESSIGESKMPLYLKGLHAAGKYSMDIYILSEPVMTVLRLISWNILGLSVGLCTLLCLIGALLIPIPVSNLIIRRVRLLRLLILGE